MIDLPPFTTAFVVKSYRGQDRRLVCDLERVGLGARPLFAVPVLTMGGGAGRFLLLPAPDTRNILRGTEVVIGYLADRSPFVLGALGAAGADMTSDDKDDESGKDMKPGYDRKTGGIQFDGASLRLRGGAVAVQSAEGKDVSIQTNGGTARISNNGDASDWAVLARALVAELAVAYEKINAQDAQIVALTASATIVAAKAFAPGPPPPGAIPPAYIGGALEPVQTTDIASRVLRLAGDLGG